MNQLQLSTEKTKLELKMIRLVNDEAEGFYPMSVELGDHAAYALQRLHRSQLTGLENITECALKTTDIFDYIKRQTARFEYWRRTFPGHSEEAFGLRLKNYLEQELAEKRDRLCACDRLNLESESEIDRQLRRRVYLLLIQQCIRQMTVQYEFRISLS
ncbi:MAG: hypothetical protein NVS4B12_08720 [Ktedonobacteraceae bacterium]